MRPRRAGIALAIVHLLLVGSLGLKLLADRARLPRAWARTLPFDPNLPIRGRYVRLRLEVPLAGGAAAAAAGEYRRARLRTEGDRLQGVLDDDGPVRVRLDSAPGGLVAGLDDPVAFFIPEHIPDPSVRPPGEELWAEVTVPHRGPPRPIRLAVRRGGTLTPLEIR
ncbi:MAG: hypothetical protein ACREM9_12120 [Gemmatimonadales bacterium]